MNKFLHARRPWFAMLIAIVLQAIRADAATIAVVNTNNALAGSLRQAIQDASPGDTIMFQIPTTDTGYNAALNFYTITLTGPAITIAKDLTIDASDAKIVLNGDGKTFFFDITGGTVNILSLTLRNGYGTGAEGAIRNNSNLNLRNCLFRDNSSSTTVTTDGTIRNLSAGILSAFNCTFVGNYGNSVVGNAGGAVVLRDCTVFSNHLNYAAIYNESPGTVRIRNTIAAATTDIFGNNAVTDVQGAFTSEGYNLIGNATQATGFGTTGDQVGASAAQVKLGPLQDNGGPTMTMRPGTGSLAIDQGNRGVDSSNQAINTDQRGQPRPVDQPGLNNAVGGDGSDIGAVEAGMLQPGPTFTVTNTGNHSDGSCTTDDCTLTEAIHASNDRSPDANVINFAPGLSGVVDMSVGDSGLRGMTISGPLTINGPGARILRLDPVQTGRVFTITASAQAVNISGLSFGAGYTNGSAFPDNVGGAVLNAASLTLTGCTFNSNKAASNGGCIYNNGASGNATVTLVNCTLHANSASNAGGAIFNASSSGHGTVNLTNCTFDQNFAPYGGAIYNDGTGSGNAALTVTNCTLNENSGSSIAGGIYNDALNPSSSGIATVTLSNTILRTGTSGVNLYNDSAGGGTITSQGSNLSNDAAGGNATNGPDGFLNAGGDRRNTDPHLDSLKNNGGATDTVALLSTSTAINAGKDANAPTTDQRGYFRNGISDIGAFEFNGIAPVPPTVITGSANNITSTTATLNATVNPNGLDTTAQFVTNFGTFPAQGIGSGTSNIPVSVDVTGLAPNAQYTFSMKATSLAGTTQGVQQSFTTLPGPSATPSPGNLGNISTRLQVGTGNNVLFAGFIIQGNASKTVLIRSAGPSLAAFGLPGAMSNPQLELHDANNTIGTNDNWQTTQLGGVITSDQVAAIQNSGAAPSDPAEPAIIATLPAGSYTAIVQGVGGTQGIATVEVYDLSPNNGATLANISTRGFIQTGDNVMIGGFIVVDQSSRVLIRATGPSLIPFGINNALANPRLELHDANGTLAGNDDWQTTQVGGIITGDQSAAIQNSGLAPSNPAESAIIAALAPGNYTAIAQGVNGGTGVGVIEVFALP